MMTEIEYEVRPMFAQKLSDEEDEEDLGGADTDEEDEDDDLEDAGGDIEIEK